MSFSYDPARRFLALPEVVKGGTICIFGIWHGRPLDNLHTPTFADWDGARLVLEFDRQLRVEILHPTEFVIEGRCFQIPTADRVVMRRAPLSRRSGTVASESFLDIEVVGGKLVVHKSLHAPPADASRGHPALEVV